MTFTHLQVRTGYSFMKSTVQIDQLVKKAKKLQYDTLALTDEAVLYGVIIFYKACKKEVIKPILGLHLNVELDADIVELLILGKLNEGYHQLIGCSSRYKAESIRTYEDLFDPT